MWNKPFIYTIKLVIYAEACQNVACIYQAQNFLIYVSKAISLRIISHTFMHRKPYPYIS